VAALICLALLGWLGYYLWHYDYEAGPPETPFAFGQIRANLRICDGTEFYCTPGVWACFAFVNTGPSRIRLVDTRALPPLYEVKLLFHDPKGGLVAAAMTAAYLSASTSTARGQERFDPDSDNVVELPWGRALTRPIPLSQIFDLRRAGKYDLTVAYRPGALALPAGQTLAGLGAYGQELQGSTSFELPFTKAPPPVQPEKAEKPAPRAQ